MTGQTDRRSIERRQSRRRTGFEDLPRGGAELIGYRIEAPDGYVGRAADFCVEEEGWAVTGLLATMRGQAPSARIFVPLNAIDRIDQRAKKIFVTPAREELRRGSRRQPR